MPKDSSLLCSFSENSLIKFGILFEIIQEILYKLTIGFQSLLFMILQS